MRVGFNYPFAYNRFGSQIGPDIWVSAADWDTYNKLAAAGQVNRIPLPPMFDHVDRNLANLKRMGLEVVRWFLLGNGNNYGPAPTRVLRMPQIGKFPLPSIDFTPPPTLDQRFTRDFEELLKRFATAKLQILPSLISFEFGAADKSGPGPNGTGYGGRADAMTDPAKRKIFLDTVLGSLLAVSAGYRDQVYAWEVINEPIWLCRGFGPNSVSEWGPRQPELTDQQMSDFLSDAINRINNVGFQSTVGHRYFDDLSRYPTGLLRQFHDYNEHSFWNTIALGYSNDPPQIRGGGLFTGNPKPILGEFDSSHNRFGDPWAKDLRGSDTTLTRLGLLASQGCEMAFIWPDLGGAKRGRVPASALTAEQNAVDASDVIKLLPDTRDYIAKFTNGTTPPPGE
jgi:hypothetical protein